MRACMAREQSRLFMIEADIAECQYKVDRRKKYITIWLAVSGGWQRSLPQVILMNIVEFLRPAHDWLAYGNLTWTPADPLLPHDPMHTHRDDLPEQFHLPDDQEMYRLRARMRIMYVMSTDYGVTKNMLTEQLSRLDGWIDWMHSRLWSRN